VSLSLTERVDSRRRLTGDHPYLELFYTLTGTADEIEAKDHVAENTPTARDGLGRESIELEPVWVDTDAEDGAWSVTVRYGRATAEESTFSFDTGGGTQHITQSLVTMARYPSNAPNCQGAIGVTHDAVEGVDITVPVYHFAETHCRPAWQVTTAYKMTRFNLTGRVNNAAFKGLAAGECLFLGAAGTQRGRGDWEITYRFAGSPNRTGLVIGSLTGISKKGWEYLWVRYADAEDSYAIVKRPVAAYVEQVYSLGDFSLLDIGT